MNEVFVPATGFRWLLPWYDHLVARCTREREFKLHVLEQSQLRRGLRILDIGCGTGTLLALALQRQPNLQLHGVEVDERILAQAEAKLAVPSSATELGSSVELRVACATDLPYGDNSFDVIVSSLVFHHLLPIEKRKCLLEAHRVLVPGGKLLLADYCGATDKLAALRFLPVRLVDGWRRTACNAAGRLPDLISQAGLADVRGTLELQTLLGTIRCYEALKPAASDHEGCVMERPVDDAGKTTSLELAE